jgi:hypothetical protein
MQEQLLTALAPEKALRCWCDPDAVKAMEQLSYYSETIPITFLGGPPTEDERMHDQYRRLREPLENVVLSSLRNGEWIATALQLPVTLNSERIPVPAHFWRFLELDFKTASADGNGLKLVEIEIERSNCPVADAPAATPTDVLSFQSLAPQRHRQTSVQLQLSDDNAILTLFDEKLIFRGTIQGLILRQLVDAHSENRRLKTAEVLSKAGTEVDSIAKTFRKNPHWPSLKKIIQQEQGFCWIDLNAPP